MGLGTFIQFTAGEKAVADDVNHNFDVISTWANGNVTSDNIGTLNDTLQFNLTTDVNGITITNSGDKTSLKITQSDELDNGESVIEIDNSTIDQLGTDSADLKIKAKTSSTIPSLLVSHGVVETLKLTRTALNLSSAVTTTLGGPLVLGNPSVTGPINLSGNLTVTGKETINRTSTNQFLELANTTTSKSLTVTPETSSFDLNINDVSSAYQFKINGVTKARIDNDGLDGSYLKTDSIPITAIPNSTITAAKISGSLSNRVAYVIPNTTLNPLFGNNGGTLYSVNFTTSKANVIVQICLKPISTSAAFGNTYASSANAGYCFLYVYFGATLAAMTSGIEITTATKTGYTTRAAYQAPSIVGSIAVPVAGVYSVDVAAGFSSSQGQHDLVLNGYSLEIIELP